MVRVPEPVRRELKIEAAERNSTISAVIIEALTVAPKQLRYELRTEARARGMSMSSILIEAMASRPVRVTRREAITTPPVSPPWPAKFLGPVRRDQKD